MRQIGKKLARTLSGVMATGLILLPGAAAYAADDEKSFEFEVGTGIEYSSRVAVDEVDTVAPDGDLAALLNAGFDFEHDLTANTGINLGYEFSKTVHDELEQFDMQSHFGSLDLSYDLGKVDVGIAHRAMISSLDGDDFLDYQQTAPYATVFFADRFFVRAELGFAEKEFDVVTERDSDVQSVGADWFIFLNGPKTYVTIGYRFDQEEAVVSQYDHDRHNFKVHFVRKFNVFDQSAKFNIGVRYETREYSDIWPSIGVNRDENRQKIRASLDLPFTDRFAAILKYELRDVESNVPEADRSDQRSSIEIVARF